MLFKTLILRDIKRNSISYLSYLISVIIIICIFGVCNSLAFIIPNLKLSRTQYFVFFSDEILNTPAYDYLFIIEMALLLFPSIKAIVSTILVKNSALELFPLLILENSLPSFKNKTFWQ